MWNSWLRLDANLVKTFVIGLEWTQLQKLDEL